MSGIRVQTQYPITLAWGKDLPAGSTGRVVSIRNDAPYGRFALVDFGRVDGRKVELELPVRDLEEVR